MVRPLAILAALLLAAPASASSRADHRAEVSPRPYCPSIFQIVHTVSVCPVGSGGCDWIAESASSIDCEWDGVGTDPNLDHDALLDPIGDYWSHPAYTLAYGIRDYAITAQILLLNTGSGWTHTFDPPAAVASTSANVQIPAAFAAQPGFLYRMWESHSPTSAVSITLYCDDGRAPVTWQSQTGGALPTVTVGTAVECRWFSQVICDQAASASPQVTECTASSGWFFAPIQGGGPGCGFGPELSLLGLMWLPRLRRRRE